MICSSANRRTISVIARCSSVRSVGAVVVAMFQLCHVGGDFCAGGALSIMGEIDRVEVKIAQIAAEQLGNITRPQLIGLGMSSTSITRWVRLGRLYRVYDGV